MSPDPCPGSTLFISAELTHGVPGFYWHEDPVPCDVCGLPGRARWWTVTNRHLCRACIRANL